MQRLRLLHWSLYTQLECKIIKKFNRFDMIALEASGLNGGWMSLWYANGANSLAHFAWLNATFVLFYFLLFLAMKVFFFKWIIVSLISNYCCSCCWWVFFSRYTEYSFCCETTVVWLKRGMKCCVSTSISHDRIRHSSTGSNDSMHAHNLFQLQIVIELLDSSLCSFVLFRVCVCAHRSLYQHRSTLFLFLSV